MLTTTTLNLAYPLQIGCCDGARLPSQNCGIGPIVLSPGVSDVDLVDEIG
jgi:hypothetical protein